MDLPPKPKPDLASQLKPKLTSDAERIDVLDQRLKVIDKELSEALEVLHSLLDDFKMRFPSAQTKNCTHCGAMIRSKAGNCTSCGRRQK